MKLGFRVQGLGIRTFRVQGSGFSNLDYNSRRFMVPILGSRVDLGFGSYTPIDFKPYHAYTPCRHYSPPPRTCGLPEESTTYTTE